MGNQQVKSIPETHWKKWLDKWFYWLLLAGILTNATGLLLPVLEPDGALYAMISKTMVLSGDYVNLRVEGHDWLDKPHFPFWMAALSFKLFGINAFAYKLPAFLFWLTGACYTYALAKLLYHQQAARLSLLIYLSAEHLILSNNDVRAEPYLTGLIIAATYYYYRAYQENKNIFILPGSLFLAAAIMTKGIFIPVVVFAGFIIEWIVKRKWNEFLKPRWWLAVLMLFLFITPELICLYLQFDRHPEKNVFGRTHVSGIRFFFWDSQFGRFFNTGPIKGKGDILFYLHTLLWAFLPWSVFPFLLLASGFRRFTASMKTHADFICGGIFVTGFILFSFSRFQLPHYLNILYPFLSLMTGNYLVNLDRPIQFKIIVYAQNLIYFLFFIFCTALTGFFGLRPELIIIPVLVVMAMVIYRLFPGNGLENIVGRSFTGVLVVNLFLNGLFYPELFSYQSGNAAAAFLEKHKYSKPVYTFSELAPEFAFEFYYPEPVYHLQIPELLKEGTLVFAPNSRIDSLEKEGYPVREIHQFRHFHISRLTGEFINQNTRNKVTDTSTIAIIYTKRKSD